MELYTHSAVMTGDIDVVTARQPEFEAELRTRGFIKPAGVGHTPSGWIHPELKLGFEVVSSTLLDGMADRDRLLLIDLDTDGVAAIIAIEDMIADRMGQFASGSAPEMRQQARALFRLHPDADLDYMEDRIRHETAGEHGIAHLQD